MSAEARHLEALARQAEDALPIFSSHRIGEHDIFLPDEVAVLASMPQFLLHKKEAGLPDTKRALQHVARFALRWSARPPQQLREHFAEELRRKDAALSVEHADTLHEALELLENPDHPQRIRVTALTRVALLSLLLHGQHYTALPRLLLARLSSQPQSPAEVAEWLKGGKRTVDAAPGVILPFKTGGF